MAWKCDEISAYVCVEFTLQRTFSSNDDDADMKKFFFFDFLSISMCEKNARL